MFDKVEKHCQKQDQKTRNKKQDKNNKSKRSRKNKKNKRRKNQVKIKKMLINKMLQNDHALKIKFS